MDGFVDWWYRYWGDARPDTVVAETFIQDGRTVRPNLTPLRVLGALAVLHPGFIERRNDQMKHAPDSFLRRHGLFLPGQKHARDAIRHGVAWAKTTKHRPTIEHYWPRRSTR